MVVVSVETVDAPEAIRLGCPGGVGPDLLEEINRRVATPSFDQAALIRARAAEVVKGPIVGYDSAGKTRLHD